MKKNYFGMIVAAAMMFAGFSLTSCSENDVAIVNGEVWVKPEVQLTDDGAIVKGSSPSDISRMISRVKNEISAAAEAGKSFKISVEASAINSTSADNAISIPTLKNSDIVLSFSNPIQTEVPLVLKSKGEGNNSIAAASTNKLEIDIPSGSSKMDMELIFPTSTVTLKGGAINKLTALTAYNTMIIESGVTIEWLKMKGGRAEVKDGGKVLGYMRDGDEQEYNYNDAYVGNDGVEPIWGYYGCDVFYMKDDAEEPYCAQNLKIVKGKAALANVYIANGLTENPLEMYIEDGAAVALSIGWAYDSKNEKSVESKINFIQGLGNKTAKIYSQNPWQNTTDKKGDPVYYASISFPGVKELKNVIVDATVRPEYYDWNSKEYKDLVCGRGEIYSLPISSTDCDFNSPEYISGTIKNNEFSKMTNCTLTCPTVQKSYDTDGYSTYPYMYNINAINSKLTAREISSISPSSENTTFKGRWISFTNYYVSGNSATIKSCKFETADENNFASVILPYQTKDRSSFNFTFDTCDFGKGFMFEINYDSGKPWYDKDGKLVTKCYTWFELDENGDYKLDDNYNYIQKRSENESDIPEINKNNGETYSTWPYKGYRIETNESGLSENAYYKDYKGIITFDSNTKLGGKAITKDTEFISYVGSGYDEKGEIATATRFVIDGVSYKAVKDSDTQKWILVEAE